MADGLMAGSDGFLGPRTGGTGGGVDAFLSEEVTNLSGTPLVLGEVVRISANDAVTRSQANIPANLQGTIGVVAVGGPNAGIVTVATEGKTSVLLEPALVPLPGDTLYVSATTPGRGTNVPPANVMTIGVIKDVSPYAGTGTVIADVDINSVTGGGFPGFGPAPASIDIGDAGNAGVSGLASRSDHEHPFPASVVVPAPVAATGAVGAATTSSRSDHAHAGVHSVHADANPQILGDAQLVAGTGITLGQAGSAITINAATAGGGGLTFGADSIAAAADTRYLTQGYDSVTAGTGVLEFGAPRAGTIKNMFVRWNNAPGGANANAVSVRLRKNGVDTLLVVSRAANAGVGQSSNLVNAIAVAQGDRIAIVCVKALAIGSGVLNPYVSVEYA